MESGDEDDAFTMGEREWLKMKQSLSKQGYREGKSEGREQGRQKQFEQAISFALKHSLKLGQILGIIDWKLSQSSKAKSTPPQQQEKLEGVRNEALAQLDVLKNSLLEEENEDNSSKREEQFNKSFSKLSQQLLTVLTDRTVGEDQTYYENIIAKMLEPKVDV